MTVRPEIARIRQPMIEASVGSRPVDIVVLH